MVGMKDGWDEGWLGCRKVGFDGWDEGRLGLRRKVGAVMHNGMNFSNVRRKHGFRFSQCNIDQ